MGISPYLGVDIKRPASKPCVGMVYGLHAFQKKAKKGIATPQQDIELIKLRLRDAELHYRTLTEKRDRKP